MTIANNVDANEIAKFSTDWWNPQGRLQTLHAINPLRLNYIHEKTGLSNKTVLDVGCGGGILAESMAKLGAKVTGIPSRSKWNPSRLFVYDSRAIGTKTYRPI